MHRELSQRELRNQSGEVMRALDSGESFVITRNGVPIGELTPLSRRTFASKTAVLAAFRRVPAIDAKRFRRDLDALTNQNPKPRG